MVIPPFAIVIEYDLPQEKLQHIEALRDDMYAQMERTKVPQVPVFLIPSAVKITIAEAIQTPEKS